jgi:hypothetical protein
MPSDVKDMSESQLSKIENKLLSVLSQHGISSQGLCNGIVMYPGIDIYDQGTISTGMQNLAATQISLSLFIRQLDSKEVFASMNVDLRGTGRTKEMALNTAINSIRPSDEKWATFINQAKKKIGTHYEKMCSKIMAQANQFSNTGQIEKALGMALSIPREVSCFEEASKLSVNLYQKYINTYCDRDLTLAKSYFAANNYADGLKIIGRIDPAASCYKDAMAEMKRIEPMVDVETRERWELLKKVYADSVELEKHRMSCIRDISVAYWENNRPEYNYLMIFKN